MSAQPVLQPRLILARGVPKPAVLRLVQSISCWTETGVGGREGTLPAAFQRQVSMAVAAAWAWQLLQPRSGGSCLLLADAPW